MTMTVVVEEAGVVIDDGLVKGILMMIMVGDCSRCFPLSR